MTDAGTRPRLKWRRRLRHFGVVILAAAVGFAVFQGLSAPARERARDKAIVIREQAEIRDALERTISTLRADNQQLCGFFTKADAALGFAVAQVPKTTAGAGFRAAFSGLQAAAQEVAKSPICPPKRR